jgi:hypothetical protein
MFAIGGEIGLNWTGTTRRRPHTGGQAVCSPEPTVISSPIGGRAIRLTPITFPLAILGNDSAKT